MEYRTGGLAVGVQGNQQRPTTLRRPNSPPLIHPQILTPPTDIPTPAAPSGSGWGVWWLGVRPVVGDWTYVAGE